MKRKPKVARPAVTNEAPPEVVAEFEKQLDASIGRWQRKLLITLPQPDGSVNVARMGEQPKKSPPRKKRTAKQRKP